jgi:hypothetical protein
VLRSYAGTSPSLNQGVGPPLYIHVICRIPVYSLIRLILFCLRIVDETMMSSPWWFFLFLVPTARKQSRAQDPLKYWQTKFLQIQSFLANSAGFRETKNHLLGVNLDGYLLSILLNMVLKEGTEKTCTIRKDLLRTPCILVCNIGTSPTSTLYLIQDQHSFWRKEHCDMTIQLVNSTLLSFYKGCIYLPKINDYLILRNPTRERLTNQPNLTLRSPG